MAKISEIIPKQILLYLLLLIPGALYASDGAFNTIQFSPAINIYDVDGDSRRARTNLQRDPVAGGLEQFSLEKESKGAKIDINGRLLSERDFGFNLSSWGSDNAYFTIKADTFRYYYDTTNLYYAGIPGGSVINTYEVDDKLYSDRGVYGFEAGTTLLDKYKVNLGYEHKVRDGKTDLYTGGWIRESPGNAWIIWEYPLSQKINYDSDKIYTGIDTKMLGYNLSSKLEWEKFSGKSEHMEPGYYQTGVLVFRRYYETKPDYINLNFDTKAERNFLDDKLLLNLGYRYERVDTKSGFDVDSFFPNGTRHYGEHSLNFLESTHNGTSGTHIFNTILSCVGDKQFKPWTSLTFKKGKARGDSIRGEEGAEAAAADGNVYTVDERWFFDTLNDEQSFTEGLGVEIAGIPKTSLNLSADFEQKKTRYDWDGNITEIFAGTDDGDWHWTADVKDFRNTYKLSARSRPADWLTVSSKYRYKLSASQVDNITRYIETKGGDAEYEPGIPTSLFYPGRIGDSQRSSHKFDISLDTKVNSKLRVRPYYGFFTEKYNVAGEPIESISDYVSNTFGLGLNLQPKDNLTVSFDVSDRLAFTHSRSKDFTNTINTTYYGGITEDFNNSALSTCGSISYQLNKYTLNLNSGYVRAKGLFDTALINSGIGVDYNLAKDTTLKTAYSFYDYAEEDNGGINDYNAHMIYLSLNKKF